MSGTPSAYMHVLTAIPYDPMHDSDVASTTPHNTSDSFYRVHLFLTLISFVLATLMELYLFPYPKYTPLAYITSLFYSN